MKNTLTKIFGKEKGIIIGAIHFPPLPGHSEFPGFDVAIKNALNDLRAFEDGGVDGVIFENNYDIPHREFVLSETADAMMKIGKEIKSGTTLPLGISVLWNDYKTALSIAKVLGLKFIRIPVFVDKVKTDYGIMEGRAEDIINFRKSIKAEAVAIFTDIHVKHSEIISKYNIVESAKLAIEKGSDGLIVTGKWTGDVPEIKKLREIRKSVGGEFPILCGSGVDATNVTDLFKEASGAIVSTSLKEGLNDEKEINIKPYEARIDKIKVKKLVDMLSL